MRFYFPVALIVILDQITKHVVWNNGQNYDFIPGYLHITLVKNAGAAFGLFQGGRVFFIVASVIAIGFIVHVVRRMPETQRARRVYLGMILGGAVGNLIDRAMSGEVVDFIQMGIAGHYWPVFNIADIGVSIGACLLLIDLIRHRETGTSVESPPPSP